MKGMDAVAGIGMSGMTDMDKLTKWIAESRLDPNDPSNTDLMHLMRVGSKKETKSSPKSWWGFIIASFQQAIFTCELTISSLEQVMPFHFNIFFSNKSN